ncbi:MAG: glycerol-3-phosphate 1-O-acyltransferase PlsY [Chitinophagaceae bacterium]
MILKLLILIIIAYLLGSLSPAIWISRRFFRIDIRKYGSCNAGATNVLRVLGYKWALLVFSTDVLKAVLSVCMVYIFPVYRIFPDEAITLQIALGLACVLGHIFPIYYNFKGGKGVATLFGMLLGIQPWIALSVLGIFIVTLIITRYVSISSMMAGLSYPVLVFMFYGFKPFIFIMFAILICFFVVFTHQKNIKRLLKKDESKFVLKNKPDLQNTKKQ